MTTAVIEHTSTTTPDICTTVLFAAEPTTLLAVPAWLAAEMRRQYEAGRACNFIAPRYESWEQFVVETVKDAVLGWPQSDDAPGAG